MRDVRYRLQTCLACLLVLLADPHNKLTHKKESVSYATSRNSYLVVEFRVIHGPR